MIKRNLERVIRYYSKEYPVLFIVGPRQSGKTTLAKYIFKEYRYVSLENIDYRKYAEEDPRGFLSDFSPPVILDEIQRTPDLFSYLQEIADNLDNPASYVLTGSQQFLLIERISQSLAGRIINFKLFPFTYNELSGNPHDKHIEDIFKIKSLDKANAAKTDSKSLINLIYKGMYPRIYDKKLNPKKYIENYILTYVERDIRNLLNVRDLRTFEDFIRVVAANSGQIINYASISNSIGVSQPTIKKWISLLETSGIVFILPPFYKNYRKRTIKTPKLYFVDTGLLCFLLSIRKPEELEHHPLFGNIFETFIISDLYKRIYHTGEIPPLYFYRDKTGNEIDLIVDMGNKLLPVEIKTSRTYSPLFKKNILKWLSLRENKNEEGIIIYRGDEVLGKESDIKIAPWYLL